MVLSLSQLNIHDKAKILDIKATGEIRRRLLDMGLVKGVRFKMLRKAPLGDPIEIFNPFADLGTAHDESLIRHAFHELLQ